MLFCTETQLASESQEGKRVKTTHVLRGVFVVRDDARNDWQKMKMVSVGEEASFS